jgi:hypothetical protein
MARRQFRGFKVRQVDPVFVAFDPVASNIEKISGHSPIALWFLTVNLPL